MATRPYNSPGVNVSETVNPSLSPFISNPSIVGIVGEAAGKQSATERLTLTGVTPVTLLYSGVNSASVIVKSAITGEVLNPGTYTITAGADPDPTVVGDEPYTLNRFAEPAAAPTLAAGTGTLTGTYVIAVSFVRATGETGIGPASSPINLTAQGISLSAVPLGATGTTARNIYRKKTAGTGFDNKFHLIATINDNTTAVLTNETTSDTTAQGDGVTTFGTALPKTGIATGDNVLVTYDYTDEFYYSPTSFDNYNDIVDKYGVPVDANGLISSPLSFAARLAFLNGASEIVAVATAGATTTNYDDALKQLEFDTTVRIVVAAGGSAAINSSVVTHCNNMVAAGAYRFGVIGRDASAAPIVADTLRQAAKALNTETVRMVSPANFEMQNVVTGKPLQVGGQYAAAAIAGMYAARDVQVPLTRKTLAGFEHVSDKRTLSDVALDSSSGLLVIEERGGILRVRHDVTTNIGSVNARESSVVRAKYEMAARLKETLDSSVVGVVVPRDQAPLVVRGAVVGILSQLQVEEVISGFSDVTTRTIPTDPTTIEVRFAYDPSYPINNINVVFTINTNSGEFTLV